MVPDWVLGIGLLLRMWIAIVTIVLLIELRNMTSEESARAPWEVLAAMLGASLGLIFLVLMPFEWPG